MSTTDHHGLRRWRVGRSGVPALAATLRYAALLLAGAGIGADFLSEKW